MTNPVLLALLLVLAGLILLGLALWFRGRSGLPAGRLVGDDTSAGQPWHRPLRDELLGLAGKPDYLIRRGNTWIPVEVKSGTAPPQPHPGHLVQLYAYCHLVEVQFGARPRHGVLRYRDRSFTVPYDAAARAELHATIAALREQERLGEANRSHNQPSRCRSCGYAAVCPQNLDAHA